MNQHFGEHVTLDGYGGDKILLNDKEHILTILTNLPAELGMHILMPPQIILAPELGAKDPGGYSGFVIIAESHISIHTFPERRFVSADVYTCKNGMDVEKIKEYFKEKFKLTALETSFIKRGLEYPNHNVA